MRTYREHGDLLITGDSSGSLTAKHGVEHLLLPARQRVKWRAHPCATGTLDQPPELGNPGNTHYRLPSECSVYRVYEVFDRLGFLDDASCAKVEAASVEQGVVGGGHDDDHDPALDQRCECGGRSFGAFVEEKVEEYEIGAEGEHGLDEIRCVVGQGPSIQTRLPQRHHDAFAKQRVVDDWERGYLEALMARAGGSITRAARTARMDRNYLRERLTRLGIAGRGDD